MHGTKLKRVLVIDDDRQFVESTRILLESHGYEVLTAQDGSEGLARAESVSPDLIVLDVMMPRRSGFCVLDKLSIGGKIRPRIVMVTASDEGRQQEIALMKGADVFMCKPFEPRDLLTAVARLLNA
jgi:DNA-binding response OmpR family regulator